jgi:hypothetical protein
MKQAVVGMMMKPLNELFEVTYGNKLDLNKLAALAIRDGGVNFVGRSSQNHGVSGCVEPIAGLPPYEPGLITVALGGSKLLSAFVQDAPFYTAQNVAVMRPKQPMTFQQKLYMCIAIRHNRFRYSAFGREANRTLRTLPVPELSEFPSWVGDMTKLSAESMAKAATIEPTPLLNPETWSSFELQALFDIRKGQRLTKADMLPGTIPYVGASDSANGVTTHIGQKPIHEGGTISVSYNGSVAEAFYQPEPYWATDDVNVLYPKGFELTPATALFICTIIRLEKYRFNYGRKWHLDRMRETFIKLPTAGASAPDWDFMENYIKSLPYSSQLPQHA